MQLVSVLIIIKIVYADCSDGVARLLVSGEALLTRKVKKKKVIKEKFVRTKEE